MLRLLQVKPFVLRVKPYLKIIGSLVEPGRIKSSTKGNVLEDVTEDKEGERRLEEEEEEFFDENEEALKAPSQLGEEQDALGRQVIIIHFLPIQFVPNTTILCLQDSSARFLVTLATGPPRKVHQA